MKLLPYQLAWLRDDSRLRVALKARRIGFSHVASLEACNDAIGYNMAKGTIDPSQAVPTIVVATKQKTANKFVKAVLNHARALEVAFGESFVTSSSQEHVTFSTGCTVEALPGGNPDALRGFEGSLILDEAAFIGDADGVFKAGWACAGPTIARPQGYRLSMISTPAGAAGIFWRAVEGDLRSQWSCHKIDIYKAVAEGFPLDIEAERTQIADEDTWRSEALCDFLASDSAYITAELYDAASIVHYEIPEWAGELRVAGLDVARRRDLSALVSGHVGRDGCLYPTSCRSEQNVPWAEQKEWVRSFIDGAKLQDARAVIAVDATGMGDSFVEGLEEEFGSAILRVNFSSSTQREAVYTALRRGFAEKRVRPDKSLTDMRRATLSVRRVASNAGGGFRIELPRRSDGHADEAVALGLACYAWDKGRAGPTIAVAGGRRAWVSGQSANWRSVY